MDATEQAIDQTLRITLTGAEYALRLTGAGSKNLAGALWSVASTKQKTKGKARLATLLKSGKELKVFNIKEAELSIFAKEAKRYGVLYAIIKGAGDNPESMADVMVRAEDAAKINRIIEKLEFGRFDETDVVVEAQRDIATKAENEKGGTQKGASKLLDELLGEEPTEEGAPPQNPTKAKTKSPYQSEPSSKRDARQPEAASADGHERRSVRAQIEEKRTARDERRQTPNQPTKPDQTRHQALPRSKRRSPKPKTEKGR